MRSMILIVDDHPLVGEAFELSIRAAYPHMDVGRVTSATEAEAYAKANAAKIKLVMLDLILPDAVGFSSLLRLQQLMPSTPIVIVSSRADTHSMALARTFGVAAYLSKSSPVAELVKAVGDVLRGEQPFAAPVDDNKSEPSFHHRLSSLSGAQLRITVALADGRLNKQIAVEMSITEGTVKQHLSAIFRKLGVQNRTQAILAARPYLNDLDRRN